MRDNMLDLMKKINGIADSEDVHVIGTGSAAEMSSEPQGYRPEDLLPNAKSLVCFGIPIPSGVYLPNFNRIETVWRTQNLYYRRLDTLSARIAVLIEEYGDIAVPIYGCMPLELIDKGKRGVTGYLNQLRMGVVTGIGKIGKNGLLINPRYGARLMLGGVVTSATLPASNRAEIDKFDCPQDCQICQDVCPKQAISAKKRKVKNLKCLLYTSRKPMLPTLRFLLLRLIKPREAVLLMNQTTFDEHTLHVCQKCIIACPCGSLQN
jgi:epoxyqueuosine reductase